MWASKGFQRSLELKELIGRYMLGHIKARYLSSALIHSGNDVVFY